MIPSLCGSISTLGAELRKVKSYRVVGACEKLTEGLPSGRMRPPRRPMSRRRAITKLGAAAVAGGVLGVGGWGTALYYALQPRPRPQIVTSAKRTDVTGTLQVFEWAGYEAEEFWSYPFKQTYPNVRVDFAFFEDENEALTKIIAGFKTHIVHPCSYNIPRYVAAGILQPIDTSRIQQWDNIWPELRNLRDIYADGDLYMVPADWGYSGISYRTDVVEEEPRTWDALWDERYTGKVSMSDSAIESVPVAGVLTRASNLWDMTDAELQSAKQLLIRQKPLILSYWTFSTDLAQLLNTGEVGIAYSWNDAPAIAAAEGAPVKFALPEKAFSWACGLAITKDVRGTELDLAYEYINSWLSPWAGTNLINLFTYGHSNRLSVKSADQSIVEAMKMNPPNFADTIFWQYQPRVEKYEEVWAEVKGA